MQIHGKFNPGPTVSAQEVVEVASNGKLRLLDVRAPVEFQRGHLPASFNGPILEDGERHQVGIIYKAEGQSSAIELGERLVAPHKGQRVGTWKEYLSRGKGFPVLTCWRGGLRSEIAQGWLKESGLVVPRIAGGYKAVRTLLLPLLDEPLGGLVLTGMTGSGKTKFLRDCSLSQVIDLERIARHRGSAFGSLGPQPAQQTFENALMLELHRTKRKVLLEDESRLIGRLVMPKPIFQQMNRLPRIELKESLNTRVENILKEYVLEASLPPEDLQKSLQASVLQVKNRLGGALTQELLTDIQAGIQTGDMDLHRLWIRKILENYYDGVYAYSLERVSPRILFRGNRQECEEWISQNFAAL